MATMSSYVLTSVLPSRRVSSACCVGRKVPPYVPSKAHRVARSKALRLRLAAPVVRATLRAWATSALGASGCGVMGPTAGRPWCVRSCLSAVRSCGVALRALGAAAAFLRLGLRLGAEVGASIKRSTNAAFVSLIRPAFVCLGLGVLAFAGLDLGLRLGLTLDASSALNFALLAALRSAFVNLRPVSGQWVGV